jgi:uncharacterized protein YdbL (DUF1318 family)
MRNPLRSLLSIVLFASLLPALAHAVTLEEAKRQGLVGEDASGYLAAVVARPDKAVRTLIADVNARRRAEYERIAAQNGVDVEDVEKVAGRKAIEMTEPGNYVRLPGEDWRQVTERGR